MNITLIDNNCISTASFEVVGYDILDGDNLFDTTKLQHAMKHCDIVIHTAALKINSSENDQLTTLISFADNA